jgi:hypothetical protein
VPGDRLALTVLIGGEQQFVGVGQQVLELAHLLLLVGRHHIKGLETVVDVHAEPGPGLLAVLGRYLGRLVGHVADVTDARLDHVSLAQVPGDGARLGW